MTEKAGFVTPKRRAFLRRKSCTSPGKKGDCSGGCINHRIPERRLAQPPLQLQSGQQIVAAGANNLPGNELPDRRRVIQDYAGIYVRRVLLRPGDERLVD